MRRQMPMGRTTNPTATEAVLRRPEAMSSGLPIRKSLRHCRCMLRELQCANIRSDGPAIVGRNAIGERIHRAVAVGYHVIEMLCRNFAQPVGVVGRRWRKTSLYNHTMSIAEFAVAGGTIDVEALLAALQKPQCERRRCRGLIMKRDGVSRGFCRQRRSGL